MSDTRTVPPVALLEQELGRRKSANFATTPVCPRRDCVEALSKALAQQAEPVAHLWQHSETGRTRVVMPDQIVTADANWIVVGPLYLAPPAAQQAKPVAWIQPDHLQKARVAPFLCRVEPTKRCSDFVPIYTAPPAAQQAEPALEPIHESKIRAEARDLQRYCLPGDMQDEDFFLAGVRWAEKQASLTKR